ncbi:MAG TPA: DUF6580 family putative transport protein [Flavisolibacter sp.]|nr:DUF6580 family putative transport protein [Flavisolibacter sp.]
MKLNKSVLLSFGLLILACSLYRVWPERPFGFAPQWAMAVFAGAVIKEKGWAFLLPLLSMLISDTVYQILYNSGTSEIWGFYKGQWSNYLLFASLTVFGFMIARRITVARILAASLAAPSAFFLISNFMVWIGGGGYSRPNTFEGLMMCYTDGVPFYQMSLLATPVFSAVLFGAYFLVNQKQLQAKKQTI